ncbi:MAG: hypothetical protein FWG12_00815 [Holophagaceae bacterium]|nr:hypothetical protein [Holophagaceae bacterium]
MNSFGIFALSFLVLSGASLSFGQTNNQPSKLDFSKGAHESIFVPDDVVLIEEKTMPEDKTYSVIGRNDSVDPRAQGLRLFTVNLKPGENIKLSFKAMPPRSYFLNWLLPRDKSHPLYSRIKRDMDVQMATKKPTISLKNTTKEPCELYFFLSGLSENPYSIKIERK